MQAIRQISEEKDIPVESVIETIEAALAAAYAKDFGDKRVQNIKVKFDPETFDAEAGIGFDVFDVKTVVEDQELPSEEDLAGEAAVEDHKPRVITTVTEGGVSVEGIEGEEEVKRFNPKTEVMVSAARESLKNDAEIGEEVWSPLEVPSAFGRMAAQTAKQVIIQRLREAERNKLYGEFKDKEHQLINATVQRFENGRVFVDLGRATGVMPPEEQIRGERYAPGERIKVFVVDVRMTTRNPEIIVSRSHPEIVRKLFTLEIPEVQAETVKIHNVAREAGSRSKVSVSSAAENVDPIGSCIGQRGTRIQTIISELGGEKIDIIQHDEDPIRYITNALSPARVALITLDNSIRSADVIVPQDQLSLAIGKSGQNVRLASKLTGWRINILDAGTAVIGEVPGESENRPRIVTDDEAEESPVEEAEAAPEAEVPEVEAEEAPVEEKPKAKRTKKAKKEEKVDADSAANEVTE
jgi:N utilization substance protein A